MFILHVSRQAGVLPQDLVNIPLVAYLQQTMPDRHEFWLLPASCACLCHKGFTGSQTADHTSCETSVDDLSISWAACKGLKDTGFREVYK